MDNILFERTIAVRYKVDVFIAGGGPAGIAAAIAAARQGKSVYLIEKQCCFGGMGTAGLVPLFAVFTDGIDFVASGVGKMIYDRCGYPETPQVWTSINVEALKRVYDDIISESGVSFSFDTQLIDMQKSGSKVTYAVCASKSGIYAVEAKVFIDATGDGDLAVMSGAAFEKGDENSRMMPPTLCSLWTNIDWNTVNSVEEGWDYQQRMLIAPIKDGVFACPDLHLPGMYEVGTNIGGGNIGHLFGTDATDDVSLTKALVRGRKLLLEYERYYKEYLNGYENMELVSTGSILGIRETRRIVCDYSLAVDTFINRAVFEDEIGRYCYPVDVHAVAPQEENFQEFMKEFTTLRYKAGESYGIPYRCLVPKGLENVLVAGRCISCDRQMLGSIRVMPGCFITGQAAGVAAAMASDCGGNTRGFDTRQLQLKLKEFGAFLPNISK